MSLHDRIMELRHELSDDEAWTKDECGAYNTGIEDAADVGKDADKLMAEMAALLEDIFMISVDQRSSKGGAEISNLLQKYYNAMEPTK